MSTWMPTLLAGLLGGCAMSPLPVAPGATAADCPTVPPDPYEDETPTTVAMRDVELVMPEGLLRVRYLDGTVRSTVPGRPPVIDDPNGYSIAVDRAEVAVDTHTLNQMMSADNKGGKKAPLASATFSTDGDLLVISGKQPVPFVLKGAMSVDPKGRLTITVVELKALGVQAKGLLDVLDLKLEDLIDMTNERGISVDGNVLHVDPLVNLLAPKVDAKVTGVSVEADGLVLRLGDTGTRHPERPTAASAKSTADTAGSIKNFVSYTGGTVIQGRLTIRDAAITLIDLDPSDPLRLAIDTVGEQVAAGYSKITTAGVMSTFVPDSNETAVTVATPLASTSAPSGSAAPPSRAR